MSYRKWIRVYCQACIVACAIPLLATLVPAQEMILGGLAARGSEKKAQPANTKIDSEWGEAIDEWKIRIAPDAKSRWGLAESPTFLLQIQNLSKRDREISIGEDQLKLVVNGKAFIWDAPGTTLNSVLKAGETKNKMFLIRLDRTQWKPDAVEEGTTSEKLSVLGTGKKELAVHLKLKRDQLQPEQVLKTGTIKFEITQSVFEMPTVGGMILGEDGKPVAGAEVYLCRDAQFSIYYSGFDGKWFKSKSVSHYDPFRGGFSSAIKPVKTNEKGEFALSPGVRDRRIIVLPPIGSAQIFDLPGSFKEWKVKLRKTGKLTIEHDIEGENGTNNASLSSRQQLAAATTNNNSVYMFTESFNLPLNKGAKYELNGMSSKSYFFNRYKYVRIGNQSYTLGGTKRTLNVTADRTTELKMVRKSGQMLRLSATNVPRNSKYVVASLFDVNQSINLDRVYNNQVIWADGAAGEKSEIEFKSSRISPGKYRLVVMSVPNGKNPNQYVYKPDYLGSKLVEVSQDGELEVGPVRLFPADNWIQNSGMALKLDLVQYTGKSAGIQRVWPVQVGYQREIDFNQLSSDKEGKLQAVMAAGRFLMAAGLDSHQPTFFEVQVPRMTPQKVTLTDMEDWSGEEGKQLKVTASFESENRNWVIEIENGLDRTFSPRFGDIQFLVQTQVENHSNGARFFPVKESPIYRQSIKPNDSYKFKVSLDEMLTKGLCTAASLTALQLGKQPILKTKNQVWSAVRIGPINSAPFPVPKLPEIPEKPFR